MMQSVFFIFLWCTVLSFWERKIEQDKKERIERKNKKEISWELYKLCRKELEETSKEWEQRKVAREQERARQERVEKAKIRTRAAKITEIEKKIRIGKDKLPEKVRTEYENEKYTKRKIEISQSKKDLWKLRSREKKVVEPAENREIR